MILLYGFLQLRLFCLLILAGLCCLSVELFCGELQESAVERDISTLGPHLEVKESLLESRHRSAMWLCNMLRCVD